MSNSVYSSASVTPSGQGMSNTPSYLSLSGNMVMSN